MVSCVNHGIFQVSYGKPVDVLKNAITSGLLPVLSDVEIFNFKNFYCTKRFAVKCQGESLEIFCLRPHLVVEIFDLEPFVSK